MPTAPAPSNGPTRPGPLRGIRLIPIRGACFALVVLTLAYLGIRGRSQTRVRIAFDEVAQLRDQLQTQLDGEPWPADPLAAAIGSQPSASGTTPATPETPDGTARRLEDAVLRFESRHPSRHLPADLALDLRLTRATLSLARREFDKAASLIGNPEPATKGASPEALRVRALRLTGDAQFGRQQWADAAGTYRQVTTLQTNHWFAHLRLAECLDHLGQTSEAAATLRLLTGTRTTRADALLRSGKPESALPEYNRAIDTGSRILQRPSHTPDDTLALATAHLHLGHARMVLENPGPAATHYQQAISLLESNRPASDASGLPTAWNRVAATAHRHSGDALLAQGNPAAALSRYEAALRLGDPSDKDASDPLDAALTQVHRGNALLALQRLPEAWASYDAALQRLDAAGAGFRPEEIASERAQAINNRGVLLRAQGRPVEALAAFTTAIQTLDAALATAPDATSPQQPPQPQPGVRFRLDVALGFAERSIDVLTRSRIVTAFSRQPLDVALATALRNRGHAHLARGDAKAALDDFQRAVDVHSALVAEQGQRALAPQLAKSINPIAWLLATSPEPSLRDGPRARALALKACQMTDWKIFAPVETLAAASAECGDFPAAVRWQEKALELAPPAARNSVAAKRDLYRSGKPLRVPLPAPTPMPTPVAPPQ